jgi:hypothetical protein
MSAWLVAAAPRAVAVIAAAISAPAMPPRRNPIWLIAEVFMALIVHRAIPPQ